MTDDDNVTKLPVKFRKTPDDGRTLFKPWEVQKGLPCHHAAFIVDEQKQEVECASCGERLNAMWVLSYLASEDRQFKDTRKLADEAMTRLQERSRTKCQHCGKMTRIRGV